MGRLSWRALEMGTISNHAGDVLGDGFIGAGEFSFLIGRDIHVLDIRMVHEVLEDGYGAVFKTVGLGEDP